MMQHRLVTGIAVVAAVAAGGVGGALLGVPALSGAQPFPASATNTAVSTRVVVTYRAARSPVRTSASLIFTAP